MPREPDELGTGLQLLVSGFDPHPGLKFKRIATFTNMKNTETFFSTVQKLTATSRLIIDEYQRNYVWTKDRAINLLKTIISAKSSVFIGSFVVYKSSLDEVQIVDGQQRLLTIYIIMKALRDIMTAPDKRDNYDDIFRRSSSRVTVSTLERVYQDLIDDKLTGAYKLSFRKHSAEVDFNKVMRQDLVCNSHSQLCKNYKSIKSYLLAQPDAVICDVYLHLLNTIQCYCMECETQVEAYRTFASINGLGQKVDDRYSIMNILFQHLGTSDSRICHILENNDKSFISRFLFYKTKRWDTRKDIVNAFTKYIDGVNAVSVADDIVLFDEYDRKCREYIRTEFLMPTPSMQVVVNYLLDSGMDSRDVRLCAKQFSAIFMRMQICPSVCHISEADTAGVVRGIKSPEDVINIIKSDNGHGRFTYPSDDEFIKQLRIYDIYRSPILKNYILNALNGFVQKRCEDFCVKEPSIEHILPQKGNEHNPLLHTIGNLTLTDHSRNSTMGSKEFSKKREVLLDSVYAINKYFEGVEKWDDDEIRKRADHLLCIALDIWSI